MVFPEDEDAMVEIVCKRCQGSDYIRSGTVRGKQRYCCRSCHCHFTATPPRGKPAGLKHLALMLYAMGNMSFCGIGRILRVSDVAVLKWVRAAGEALPEPEMPSGIEVVMIDEMHHFLKKSQTSSGFGEPTILSSAKLCPGFLVTVVMQPVKNSSPKSASKAKSSSPTTGKASTARSPKTSSLPVKT